jgi:hypothetical protein
MNRTLLLERLHYTERYIAAGIEAIEKQRQTLEHVRAGGGDVEPARASLAQMERAQLLHIADRDTINQLLAT